MKAGFFCSGTEISYSIQTCPTTPTVVSGRLHICWALLLNEIIWIPVISGGKDRCVFNTACPTNTNPFHQDTHISWSLALWAAGCDRCAVWDFRDFSQSNQVCARSKLVSHVTVTSTVLSRWNSERFKCFKEHVMLKWQVQYRILVVNPHGIKM